MYSIKKILAIPKRNNVYISPCHLQFDFFSNSRIIHTTLCNQFPFFNFASPTISRLLNITIFSARSHGFFPFLSFVQNLSVTARCTLASVQKNPNFFRIRTSIVWLTGFPSLSTKQTGKIILFTKRNRGRPIPPFRSVYHFTVAFPNSGSEAHLCSPFLKTG